MRSQSSIRHSKKTPEEANSLAASFGFNRKRLAKELLSLGNPKITPPVAETISLEVEKELLQKDDNLLSPETVSELVRFKLEEMGLIEIRPRQEKVRKIQTEKAMKITHPFMPQASPLRLALKSAPMQTAREKFQWSAEGKKAFAQIPEWLHFSNTAWESPEAFLDTMSRALADIDSNFEGFHDNESTAVQFFNRMASLDFVPGHLLFKTDYKTGALSAAPACHLAKTGMDKVYETISQLSQGTSPATTTLGIQLQDKPESDPLLLLKLLKTSLEYKAKSGESDRQEIYLSFPAPDLDGTSLSALTDENDLEDFSPPFAPLFEWLEAEENRKYFSLSLGVPGRTTSFPPALESSERSLARILHRHLLANSSVRLYFLERCLEAMNTPQGQADRLPNPQSPGLYAPGEIVPSLFLNLAVMVKDEELDWDRLRRAARQAVHFLDNVIDFWAYPNAESEKITKSNRSIALGVMGLADLLFTLRIPYNSQEGLDLAARIAEFVQEEAQKSSIELAKTRGVFPNYIGSRWQEKGLALRNAQICSLVWDPLPSLIAQTSMGIEPHPSLVELEGFDGEKPKYLIHPFLAETARKRGFLNDKVLARIVELRSLSAVQEIPDDIRKVFVNSADVSLPWHLLMAASFEKHFDYGVVKACPLPIFSEGAENIQGLLDQARELGLRSLWIKREGEVIAPVIHALPEIPEIFAEEAAIEEAIAESEDAILEELLLEDAGFPADEWTEMLPVDELASGTENAEAKTEVETNAPLEVELAPAPRYTQIRERPETLQGLTRKQPSCCGDLHITVNQDEQGPYELLAHLSKTFGNESPLLDTISKLVSLALRGGIDPRAVLEQLQGVVCLRHLNTPQASIASPLEALAREVERLVPAEDIPTFEEEEKTEVLSSESLAG